MASRKHALAVPLPAQGHLHPLMRLCETLVSPPFDAFTITFLNIDPIHQRLAQRQLHSISSHIANSNQLLHPHICPAAVPVPGLNFENLFQNTVRHTLDSLQSLIPSIEQLLHQLNQDEDDLPAVSCLISDFSVTSPTQVVADNFSIPRITLFSSSASMLLLLDYVLEGIMPINEVMEVLKNKDLAETHIVKDGLPGLPCLTKGDLPHTPSLEGHPDDEDCYLYNFLTQNLRSCKDKGHSIVVNSFEELEPEEFATLRERLKVPVFAIGPLKGSSNASLWQEDEECLDWLDKQPQHSVIYITSGSLTFHSREQCDEMRAALLASGQRFLWVFRTEGATYQDTGASFAEFLTQTGTQGRVVGWAPQIRVLSHPAVAAFVSHCGWNSTLEAVANGVPLLCLPLFYDQFLDAKYAVQVWKMGLRLSARSADGVVDRDELQRAFKAVMEGEQSKALRENAKRLRNSSCHALLPGGSTYNNLQSFIQSLQS